MNYAKIIRSRREEVGLSLRELAKQAGVSWMTIHEWENGAKHMRLDKLENVLEVLGLCIQVVEKEEE